MAYYIRKKKKTNECDCSAPVDSFQDGMGPVIPGVSGDRFDTILGAGFVNSIPMMPASKKKYKVKKNKK